MVVENPIIAVLKEAASGITHLAWSLEKGTHAGFIMVTTSAADEALRVTLAANMSHLTPRLMTRSFEGYGPLANFASKLDMASATGIIDRELYLDLRLLNKARVLFAHSSTQKTFSDPEIAEILKRLPDALVEAEHPHAICRNKVQSVFNRLADSCRRAASQ